jgi:DNA primase
VIIVEGYTDVMAMHIAGYYNTVGTCGTAFANSHAKLLRRIMGDWGTGVGQSIGGAETGEVIFIFDGDEAGQAAAKKSFKEDQSFASLTLVAIVPDNLDPCDLRIKGGDEAIQNLVNSAQPLFEYIIKTSIKDIKLDRPEMRISALRAAAPIIASIKDSALRIQYTDLAAGWLRLDYNIVRDAVAGEKGGANSNNFAYRRINSQNLPPAEDNFQNPNPAHYTAKGGAPSPKKNLSLDKSILSSILQYPEYVPEAYFQKIDPSFFEADESKSIYKTIIKVGGLEKAKQVGSKEFSQMIFQNVDDNLKEVLSFLINAPLLLDEKTRTDLYVQEIFKTLILKKLNFFISEYKKKIKSLPKSNETEKMDLIEKIFNLEKIRRSIRE